MIVVTVSDILTIALVSVVVLLLLFVQIATYFRQLKCKHDGGVNETQACDAICRKCGKNLGFIGTWRKDHQ